MNGPNEALHCGGGCPDLPFHAAARIQQQTHAYRKLIRLTKVRNLLFLSIFKDDEVVFGEVGNVVAGFVCDCRDHIDQRNINLQLSGDKRNKEEDET